MTIFTEILCDSHERAARPQVISQISDELFYKGFPQRCDYKLKLWEISHTTLHSNMGDFSHHIAQQNLHKFRVFCGASLLFTISQWFNNIQ